MATVLSTLYPPLIDTFMPAFPYTGPASVNFSISPYNSWKEIKNIHVTLVNQKTNQNAFGTSNGDINGTALTNGIWIVPFSADTPENILSMNTDANLYTLNIPSSLLKNQNNNNNKEKTFICDYYYKVQIRFDCYSEEDTSKLIDITNPDYLIQNRAYFSEWSSVCLLKAIPNIRLHLNNFTLESTGDYAKSGLSIIDTIASGVEPVRVPQYVPGIIPFSGNLTFSNNSGQKAVTTTSGSEYLQYYQIQIRNESEEIIEDSGKIYVTEKDKMNSFYWLCDMTNTATEKTYTVSLTFTTNNQYTFSKDFQFKLIETSIIEFNPVWNFNKRVLPENGVEKEVLVTSEDGLVTITVDVPSVLPPGYLFIKRACSKDNYKKWELIDCTYMEDGENISRTIVDRTVGSLVNYKYSCQYLTQKGSWTRTAFTQEEIVYPDFYDILISRGNKQLAIRYNEQIASMTPVINRVKIDTLGGKYPKFAENAKLNYKQFNLTGLITAESDYNRCFMNDLDYPEQMKNYDDNIGGAYAIRNDTVKEEFIDQNNGTYTADIVDASTYINKRKRDTQKNTYHDLYPMDNWWWEREFREEAIKWLNDGEPKLYRSMTEGNMIVMLNDITLTPNIQLGRRIWNFSATVYEVGDGYSLEELEALGIYSIENAYNANFSNNTNQDAEEKTATTTGTIRESLGQQYRVKDESDGNGTKIVLDGLVQNKLEWLYSGLYENYTLVPNSIKLRDVKIQFESLPQWYNLDTLNPDSPSAPLITISVNGNDKIYKFVEKSNSWVELKTNNIFNGEEITKWLSNWEQESNYHGHGGNVLVKVDVSSGDSTEIISNNANDTTNKIINIMNNTQNDFSENSYGLGYRLRIDFASPYTADSNSSLLSRTIFVNKQGYYQIPSNLIVKQIIIYDGAVATIDYIMEYNLDYSDATEPDSYEVADTIVGQVSGKWNPNTNVTPIIKAKYAAYDKNDYTITQQMLDSWKAISFDLTPYSIVDFKFVNDTYTTQRIVGRTGVLTLEPDYPVDLCVIRGKRMVEAPLSRQPFLDDWEYVLDESVTGRMPGTDLSRNGNHWWIMSTIDEDAQDESNILVEVFLETTYDDRALRALIDERRKIGSKAFNKKHKIKKPKVNTIYETINNMGFLEYKIYYQDYGWYNVVFPNIEDTDLSIAHAQVPVYGMIGYKANIMKKLWIQ